MSDSSYTINTDGTVLFRNIKAANNSHGPLANIPANPKAGDTYLATDQPLGQQYYSCSVDGQWFQFLTLGGSGGLYWMHDGDGHPLGTLDINLAVVPTLHNFNHFTGSNQLDGITTLQNVEIKGSLTVSPEVAVGTRPWHVMQAWVLVLTLLVLWLLFARHWHRWRF